MISSWVEEIKNSRLKRLIKELRETWGRGDKQNAKTLTDLGMIW